MYHIQSNLPVITNAEVIFYLNFQSVQIWSIPIDIAFEINLNWNDKSLEKHETQQIIFVFIIYYRLELMIREPVYTMHVRLVNMQASGIFPTHRIRCKKSIRDMYGN